MAFILILKIPSPLSTIFGWALREFVLRASKIAESLAQSGFQRSQPLYRQCLKACLVSMQNPRYPQNTRTLAMPVRDP